MRCRIRPCLLLLASLVAGCSSSESPPEQDVPSSLVLSQGELDLALRPASEAPAAGMVHVESDGYAIAGLHATIQFGAGSAAWLTASFSSSSTPSDLHLEARALTLPPGTHHATVTLASSDTTVQPEALTVTLVVGALATLEAAPGNVALAAEVSGPAATATVTITSTAGYEVDRLTTSIAWAGSGSDWLTATLDSTRTPAQLVIATRPGTVPEGEHAATVTVTAPGAAAVTLPIALALADSRATVTFVDGGWTMFDLSPGTGWVTGPGFSCRPVDPGCATRAWPGESLDLAARGDSLNRFIQWDGACGDQFTATCRVTVQGDTTIRVHYYIIGYDVIATLVAADPGASGWVQASGSSWVRPDPCHMMVSPDHCGWGERMGGRNVMVTAYADSGSVFLGWTGECSGTGGRDCVVLPNPGGRREVTATFGRAP